MKKAKAVVFDNSGTLIKRYRAIKNIKTGTIFDDKNSIDIIDEDINRALVVLQTDPSKCINKANPNQTIHHFLKKNHVNFDVSYSSYPVDKKEVLNIIKDDISQVSDVQDTLNEVIRKHYNVEICSGSGFIINVAHGEVEFTITAGGKIFKEVPNVINELKKREIDIFVASGDRTASLEQLASYIDIPRENIYPTADSRRKKEIIESLKKNYKVMMVGNSSNDILAIEEADLGILTLQQEEDVPKKVFDKADVVVYNIKDILAVDF
ncbi:MAG: HAD family hydrolase [Methanobacterium sp.]|nr:HAD family hydrolase [Methanobacterium sp.]